MYGKPKLLSGSATIPVVALVGDVAGRLFNFIFPAPKWGIFAPGSDAAAVRVDSVISLDMSSDSRVSDYPIQTGSFTSYNKVRMPDMFRVELSREGGESERAELLAWLDANVSATTVFDVAVPEKTWTSATLVSVRIGRSARSGAGRIVADCIFQQIKEQDAEYSSSEVTGAENKPARPAARVNAAAGEPNSAGGDVAWG